MTFNPLTEKQPGSSDQPASRHLIFTRDSILRDYRIGYQSRQASLIGRREVLTGKAKFGIFGGGKEVAQLAMARAFRDGDFRSGYYRDQTFMFATGMSSIRAFFAQLYAHADLDAEPASAGRQMTAHFATRTLDESGAWRDLTAGPNSSADVSPTGSQMPRLVGLAYASRLYRELDALTSLTRFSKGGDEIAFGTIGNASAAEGMFWEAVNAAGVLKAPMLLSIWDDEYGISVPNELQLTKGDLSSLLSGFRREKGGDGGFELFTVPGWDYAALCETYLNAASIVRMEHVPAIIHVTEMTQPQGHSTSGSHERYKSEARLAWEKEHDCLTRMRRWMLETGIATAEELDRLEKEDREKVTEEKLRAWKDAREAIDGELKVFVGLAGDLAEASGRREEIDGISAALLRRQNPLRRDILASAQEVLLAVRDHEGPERERLAEWRRDRLAEGRERYSSRLHSSSDEAALAIEVVPPRYDDDAPQVNGFEVLNACFDAALARDPRVIALGEDVGKLGDVNQGFVGLQDKYGLLRVSDTGIRETTIAGQAIGMAMRGLRPIAEIQYLDYILYALQILSDDLATVRYRTFDGQKAPVIIRTRGHRLEGIWHSGSPMGALIHLLRGVYLCVPRDMTQAAGFYNTLLRSDDPAVVIEVLNGYRAKERLPSNVGEMTVPLGQPEILRAGSDLTLVTYGACCRIALDAADQLAEVGIDVEVVDVQTLLPFDLDARIAESVAKTNRLLIVDEDVPGGASAFILQQVVEEQRGFFWLDSEPRTLTAPPHRPAYGSDGDYWSKPNRDSIFEAAYEILRESDPQRFPRFL